MSRSLEPTDARKNRKDVMKTQTLLFLTFALLVVFCTNMAFANDRAKTNARSASRLNDRVRAARAYSAPVVDRTNEGPNFANGAMSAPAGR